MSKGEVNGVLLNWGGGEGAQCGVRGTYRLCLYTYGEGLFLVGPTAENLTCSSAQAHLNQPRTIYSIRNCIFQSMVNVSDARCRFHTSRDYAFLQKEIEYYTPAQIVLIYIIIISRKFSSV